MDKPVKLRNLRIIKTNFKTGVGNVCKMVIKRKFAIENNAQITKRDRTEN